MKLSRRRFLYCASCTAIAAALAACAPASDEPQPPEIAYGHDVCDCCGMIISEPRYACATLLTNGRSLKFDDIGDLVVYHMDHPEAQATAYFVHDYKSQAWTRGEAAYYSVSVRLKTPMGHGVAAFAQQAEAQAFAVENEGTLLTFDELRAHLHAKLHG